MQRHLSQRANCEDQRPRKTLQGGDDRSQAVSQSVSYELPQDKKERALQSSKWGQQPRYADGELLQQQGDAQIDLGINGEGSTQDTTGLLVAIDLNDNSLRTKVMNHQFQTHKIRLTMMVSAICLVRAKSRTPTTPVQAAVAASTASTISPTID